MSFVQEFNRKAREIHNTAKVKGWYDDGMVKSPLEAIMLVVSELSEAVEEVRKNNPPVYVINHEGKPAAIDTVEVPCFVMVDGDKRTWQKPEGEVMELADAVIRIMDYCAHKQYDLGAAIEVKALYNETRPYRHGGKAY